MPSMTVIPLAEVKDDGYSSPRLSPLQLNDLAQKEAVGKIGDESLEAATSRLFLGKTDGQRYGKKEREAFKDRPRAALDDGPENVPRGSVYGEIADDVRSRCRAETPTMRPDIENSMAGANIAPPKRWIFCSMFCLPNIEARCAWGNV